MGSILIGILMAFIIVFGGGLLWISGVHVGIRLERSRRRKEEE